jgi:hypothetical protein
MKARSSLAVSKPSFASLVKEDAQDVWNTTDTKEVNGTIFMRDELDIAVEKR